MQCEPIEAQLGLLVPSVLKTLTVTSFEHIIETVPFLG